MVALVAIPHPGTPCALELPVAYQQPGLKNALGHFFWKSGYDCGYAPGIYMFGP